MLFVDIITWEPKDNDEVLKRFMKWEYPEGIKVVGEWSDLSSCRHIVVYDAKSADAYMACTYPWIGICRFDSFPAMAPDDIMKFMEKHM
jgi:hypothetical protein